MTATVVPFNPTYLPHFRDLNLFWIKKFFVVELLDIQQLEHPETTILKDGGEIFFVQETVDNNEREWLVHVV
jgi:putative acetyltransferase